ncbi:MAG: crossover junction endodeoxyribonuclease RuvC [Candidatus Peregrinibacteria bacterium]|nr:crossover junction endodeoxyribonuclease RuvC [Candidatus Peregrinibacteria bacterium]
MQKTVLGIDPGFGLCGFAVIKDENLETFGVIKTSPRENFPDRLHEIAEDFQTLLDKHQPTIVSIEDLFFVQNITTGIQVAEVRGVLLFLAQKFGCQIIEPKPVEIKKCFTGSGNASKAEMKKMAKLMFKLENSPKIDDAADAIATAFYAIHSH